MTWASGSGKLAAGKSQWCKPVFYPFGKLHCRVLNLKNTCSPLFSGERKPCHFNMGFKLDPLWNSPGSVERNKKQKQQDIYGIAGFEAFLALS